MERYQSYLDAESGKASSSFVIRTICYHQMFEQNPIQAIDLVFRHLISFCRLSICHDFPQAKADIKRAFNLQANATRIIGVRRKKNARSAALFDHWSSEV